MSLVSLLLWGSDSEQLWIYFHLPYRSLLASLSDSRSVSTSPSLTGPFTFLMMERLLSSMNSTRTCKWQEAKRRQMLVALVELWKLWYRHHTSYSHHREDPYNAKWGPNIASEWAQSHCVCINPNTDRQSSNFSQVSLNKEMVVEFENGLKADRIALQNYTRKHTCVHCPWEPVLPRTLVTYGKKHLTVRLTQINEIRHNLLELSNSYC